jgi:hypothetical protein
MQRLVIDMRDSPNNATPTFYIRDEVYFSQAIRSSGSTTGSKLRIIAASDYAQQHER